MFCFAAVMAKGKRQTVDNNRHKERIQAPSVFVLSFSSSTFLSCRFKPLQPTLSDSCLRFITLAFTFILLLKLWSIDITSHSSIFEQLYRTLAYAFDSFGYRVPSYSSFKNLGASPSSSCRNVFTQHFGQPDVTPLHVRR